MDASKATTSDQRHIFPFLRLAAELRNRIYEYALVQHRYRGEFANVALLQVCKEVHREAKGIFLSQATFCVTSDAETCWNNWNKRDRKLSWEMSIKGDIHQPEVKASSLEAFTNIWPRAVAEVPRIYLSVDLSRSSFSNHLLHSLASTLRQSTLQTQELEVYARTIPSSKNDVGSGAVYPLSRMPAHLNITYGRIDPVVRAEVETYYLEGNKVKQPQPAHLTFDSALKMQELRPKVEAHLSRNWKPPQGSNWVAVRDGRKFIIRTMRRVDEALKSQAVAFAANDALLMTEILVLERWVEMRDAGICAGDKEIEELVMLGRSLLKDAKIPGVRVD